MPLFWGTVAVLEVSLDLHVCAAVVNDGASSESSSDCTLSVSVFIIPDLAVSGLPTHRRSLLQ
jgi:hypothetical protein